MKHHCLRQWHVVIGMFMTCLATALTKTTYNITRHYQGDIFSIPDGNCNSDMCISDDRRAVKIPWAACECQCTSDRPTFRQDLEKCVNNIPECGHHLATFVGPTFSETIPLVFLPKRNGLVYPTTEISLSDPTFKAVGPNICTLTELKILSTQGWELAEKFNDNENPSFKPVGGSGKLFLQFTGDDVTRKQLEGQVALITVVCHRESSASQRPGIPSVPGEYCIVFRVAHVAGASDAILSPPTRGGDFVIIGLCAGLLGVTYVGAVLIYLLVRWQRKNKASSKTNNTRIEANSAENGSAPSRKSVGSNGHIVASTQLVSSSNENFRTSQEPGSYESCQTRIEKAPHNDLHVETMANGHLPTTSHPANSGNSGLDQRRRLIFDPSFLDLDVLHSPPPAAAEFLFRIREMISIATTRIRTCRFLPSLVVIPEETHSLRSIESPNPSKRIYSSSKEGISNEAFEMEEGESENDKKCREVSTEIKNKADNAYSWISDEAGEEFPLYTQSDFKVQAETDNVLFRTSLLADDDDCFNFLARIPEDGELIDNFDGLYDFESFRQEMVKKMQKKRRNQMKPQELNGEFQLGSLQAIDNSWENENPKKLKENGHSSRCEMDSLDALNGTKGQEAHSSGIPGVPKFSRFQILQRMFQGNSSDDSSSEKEDSDVSFDSIPKASDDQSSGSEKGGKRSNGKIASPKMAKKPLATYLFGETLLKVAATKNNSPSFSYKKKDKQCEAANNGTKSQLHSPPKIERLKRKFFGSSEIVSGSSTKTSDCELKAGVSAQDVESNLIEYKKRHKQVLLVNRRSDGLQHTNGGSPSVYNQPNNSNISVISNSANVKIQNEQTLNHYDTPTNLSPLIPVSKNTVIKHFPEDSGYHSSDSDQSTKGVSNRISNKIKSFRNMLSSSSSSSPTSDYSNSHSGMVSPLSDNSVYVTHNGTTKALNKWVGPEGTDNYLAAYNKNIPNGHRNNNKAYSTNVVSTIETSIDLGDEDVGDNSSDSEYADSLEGVATVR